MLLASLLAPCVWAVVPTPVAHWTTLSEGAKGGEAGTDGAKFSIRAGTGCTFTDGKAVTTKTSSANNTGLLVEWEDGAVNNILTIVVKYSNYSTENGNNCLLTSNWGNNEVVAYARGGASNVGLAANVASNNVGTQQLSNPSYAMPTAGYIMMTTGTANNYGTALAFKPEGAELFKEIQYQSGYRYVSGLKHIKIGGTVADHSKYYRPTLTIEEITIYTSKVTAADLNAEDPQISFTKASSDWDAKTLPTRATTTEVTQNTSFAGNAKYLATLGTASATVAKVTGANNNIIYGLHAMNGDQAGLGNTTRDIYLMVSGGTFNAITGGEDATWNGTKTVLTGDTLVNINGDTTVDYVYGAGMGGGNNVTTTGDTGVVIEGNAQVKGTVAGGWQSRHDSYPKVTGNTTVLVKNVQTNGLNTTTSSGNHTVDKGLIVGGSIYWGNGGAGTIEGSSAVVIDIAAGTTTSTFAKKIVGGSYHKNDRKEMTVKGNSSVTITAPNTVTFNQEIIGGGHSTGSQSKVEGNSSVTINGGTYTSNIYAGGNHTAAPVSGTATITVNQGNVSGAIFKPGTATGVKKLQFNADQEFYYSSIADFDEVGVAADTTLIVKVAGSNVKDLGNFSGTGTLQKKESGTLRITGGTEGKIVVDAGTLSIKLTIEQQLAGYQTTATVNGGTLNFVDATTGSVLANASTIPGVYEMPKNAWNGSAGDSNWDTPENWSYGTAPTSRQIIAIESDATINVSSSSVCQQLVINADTKLVGQIANGAMPNIVIANEKTLTIETTSESTLNGVSGGTLVKEGAGTLRIATAYTTDIVLAAGTLQVATAETMPTVTTTDANKKVSTDTTMTEGYTTYTLRTIGGKVYYKEGDWTDGCTVWANADHTATTTFCVADTMVLDTDNTVVYPKKEITSALKIEIAAGITAVIGHDDYLTENAYNVPNNSVITLGEGAHLGVTFWNNTTDYTPAFGTVTINGGTFGVYNVPSKAINAGTIKGTSQLVLKEGETITVSGSIETTPISGVETKKVKKVTNAGEPTTYTYSLFTPAASITVDGVATYFETIAEAIAAIGQQGDITQIQIIGNPTIPSDYCVVDGHLASAVAKIGDTGYATLQAAMSAVANNETIVLLGNVGSTDSAVEIKNEKTFTLDLGGYTLSTYYIDLYQANVTITHGKVSAAWAVCQNATTTDVAYNSLTIAADATIEAADTGVVVYQAANGANYGSTLVVEGTIQAPSGVWVMGNITTDLTTAQHPISVTISGTITATNVGVALNGAANMTIAEGASITAGEVSVEARAGNLTIDGGTFTSTATSFACVSEGSGTTTTGAALSVAQHTTKLPMTITVNGGTFSGVKSVAVANVQGATAAQFNVKVALNGGTFSSELAVVGDVNGATVTKAAEATVTAPEGYAWQAGKLVKTSIGDTDLKPTTTGVVVEKPMGTDTVEIHDSEGVVISGTTIPHTTGVYTIKAKKDGVLVAESTIGVVKVTPATSKTTAVAVPFEGATVANLLNTALLNENDKLMALNPTTQAYQAWTLDANKKWQPMRGVTRDGGTEQSPNPTTTTLKRGAAVWVTTVGQVVAFGAYDSTTPADPDVVSGYNLIGNPTMEEAYTPAAKTVGDVLIPVGSSTRYKVIEKTVGGVKKNVWQCTKSVQNGVIPGTTIPAFREDVSEEDPTVPVGGSVWLIK